MGTIHKKWGRIIITPLLLAGLTLSSGCQRPETPGMEEDEYTAVEVVSAARGEIKLTAQAGGTVKPGAEVAAVARLGGEVESLRVSLGDYVEKGDVLVSLSAPDINLQVRQARDAVNTLRKSRNELRDTIEELEELLEDMDPPGENGEGEEASDPDDAGENSHGEETGNDSEEDPKEEENGEEEIPQWLRDLLGNGGFQLDPTASLRQQLAALEAQLKQAQWSLEMARLGQENLSVRAPISGVVTYINVTAGAMAAPGTPLLMIADHGGYRVEANVLENLITLIDPGDPVHIELPMAGKTYPGIVEEVSPAPLPGSRVYPVKISFEPEDRILPGMFARISFVRAATGETLVIPRSAVLQRSGETVVFVAEDGLARAREVALGLHDGDRVQITGGLKEGESLVVKGQHYLEEGSPIKIVPGLGGREGADG